MRIYLIISPFQNKPNIVTTSKIPSLTFLFIIDLPAGPLYKHSLNDHNSVIVCVRDKIQTVSERGESLYSDYKVL